nr:MAG TPA: hypothetical protein [Bacteriophage sp.]
MLHPLAVNRHFLEFLLIPSVCPSLSNSELYIDKRETHRYYVSVSQQNIGYKSAKTGNPLGAWFFVASIKFCKAIITHIMVDVNAFDNEM